MKWAQSDDIDRAALYNSAQTHVYWLLDALHRKSCIGSKKMRFLIRFPLKLCVAENFFRGLRLVQREDHEVRKCSTIHWRINNASKCIILVVLAFNCTHFTLENNASQYILFRKVVYMGNVHEISLAKQIFPFLGMYWFPSTLLLMRYKVYAWLELLEILNNGSWVLLVWYSIFFF